MIFKIFLLKMEISNLNHVADIKIICYLKQTLEIN